MNILIANDDGIEARGIRELVTTLSQVADIYVCAPDGQRSAFSHAISTGQTIHIKEVKVPHAQMAFAIGGTPADCVKVGMRIMRGRGVHIDMVFAGINHGSNLGTDTIYSGTVGAAIEGNLCGVPAVAVSVGDHMASHFDYACKLALNVVERCASDIPDNMVLNINVPDIPSDQIKGVKYTVLGDRDYIENLDPQIAAQKEFDYSYGGVPVEYEDLPDTIDVIADQNQYATITPLQHDMTYYGKVEEIKNWGIDQ